MRNEAFSLDQYCNSQQAHSDRTLWSGSGQLLHNFRSGQGHLTHKNVFSKEAGANFLTLHRSSSQIWPGIFRPWLTVTIKYCKLSHTHPHTHTHKQTNSPGCLTCWEECWEAAEGMQTYTRWIYHPSRCCHIQYIHNNEYPAQWGYERLIQAITLCFKR